jgi:hypothetical protein
MKFTALFTVHIIGFALSFYLRYLLGKLHNLLIQSDFKLAGLVLTQFTLAPIVSRPIVRTFSTKLLRQEICLLEEVATETTQNDVEVVDPRLKSLA